jgi:hypothetical protein
MYATVRVYTGADGFVDALVANEGAIRQLIGNIDGFKAYYLVRTAEGAASISVYETQSGAEESNAVAASWVRENVPDLNVAPPQVSAGEVAIGF